MLLALDVGNTNTILALYNLDAEGPGELVAKPSFRGMPCLEPHSEANRVRHANRVCHNEAFCVRSLRKFLAAMGRRPRWSWAALAVYAAAVTFPHEKVQYEVNEIAIRITLPRLYQVSAAIVLALGALLTFIVFRSLAGQAGQGRRHDSNTRFERLKYDTADQPHITAGETQGQQQFHWLKIVCSPCCIDARADPAGGRNESQS